jgi:protocatechuate 3,4-dioxygenase beta subunit
MLVESPLRLRPRLTKPAILGVLLLAAMIFAVGSGLRHEVTAQDDVVVERGDNALGTVVDEKGKPVMNVSIRLFIGAPVAATTVSDARGRFFFDTQQEKWGTLVADDVDGKRIGYGEWYPRSDRSYPPQIVLKPVREVMLKVVDSGGAPVAGAKYASPGVQYDLDDLTLNGKTGEDGTARLRFSDDARLYQVIAFKSGLGFDYFVSPRRPGQELRERLPGEITLTLAGARTLVIKAEDQKRQPAQGVRFSLDYFKKPEAKDPVSLSRCDAVERTTAASGTAVFDWLPDKFADSLRFDCDSPEYAVRRAPGWVDLLWLRHDDPAKEWTVPVLRRTAISGKVVDQNGNPLPRIIVKASGVGAGGSSGQAEVITDSEGAYRMMVPGELAYLVGVVDDRWAAPTRTGLVVRENQPVNNIDFKANEGAILRGTVIDQTGRPLANRQVVLLLEGKQIPAEIALPASQRIGATRLYHHRMSRSDDRGQFQFRVAPGTYKLGASESGAISSLTPQAEVTIDGQREVVQDLQVQVDKTVRLKGSVVDPDGKPVADQQLLGTYLRDIRYVDEPFEPQTRPDGTFEVERKALPAVISVRIEDRKLGALVRLDADQNEVAIKLSHLVEAHGRFVDEKGQGTPGRRIRSSVEDVGVLLSEAITDANGNFTLVDLLPDEEHDIRLREGNQVPQLTKVMIKGPGPFELGDLRLPPIPDQEALTLKGKVVGSDGKPVAGAEVRAVFLQSPTRGTRRNAQAKTSAEGTFEIKRPAVPAVISVRTAYNKHGGLLRVDDKQTVVALRMGPLGKARGILTDSSGKALAGATITSSIIVRATPGYSVGILGVSAITAADGSYTLEGLLPNESYTVRHVETSNGKAGRSTEIKTIKLEKAETVDLGKTPLS